eukprot:gnl/MRDRNA2_/MRDRNA2_88106_c0_seq1.p1 gnl/MRDRNA2_/MRDRNA2_88106_c0~~gnl/MRDRNA2_/MRDRNA2_88106_c0_seq1.p1  ORF type:complete len:269 (-),score=77.33 gnl/MRDRNA2_/MRDRNA2_88106_c0_seq1:32-838(-)
MAVVVALAFALFIPASADIPHSLPEPVPEYDALTGLEEIVGRTVDRLTDDFHVMEKYVEQESMLQTMSFRRSRHGAKKHDQKPQMISLLQQMLHRFQKSVAEVNDQEKKSRTQYVQFLGRRINGKFPSEELRAKAKKLRDSQKEKYHALLQMAHGGMQRVIQAMSTVEKQTKFSNKKMEEQNPLVPLGALESPESVMAGVNHDLHKFAVESEASLAQLKQGGKTAPDVEAEVAKEKMADVYIHDSFGEEEKKDVKAEKEVKANPMMKP